MPAADQPLVQWLRAQILAYTLKVCGADGQTKVYQMSALRELLWEVKQLAAVVEKIADPAIKIIMLTGTEGGHGQPAGAHFYERPTSATGQFYRPGMGAGAAGQGG